MTQSPVFEWLTERIAHAAGWNRLVARGTVRIALKEMGLDPRTVGKREMAAVLRTNMTRLLEAHKVDGARGLCERLDRELGLQPIAEVAVDAPEDIFKRLARNS